MRRMEGLRAEKGGQSRELLEGFEVLAVAEVVIIPRSGRKRAKKSKLSV